MKNMNLIKKYGSKSAVMAALTAPALAYANTDVFAGLGTTIATEINRVIPLISSAGTALLSVYLLIKGLKMLIGFLNGRS